MASYQFFHDAFDDIVNRKAPLAPSKLRLKDNLKEQISEFLSKRRAVARIDGVDDLTRFL
jgi:hypothetical protein